MYCCDRCSFAQYHPLSYCPRCPGKLHRRDVPHPQVFATDTHQQEWLKEQGIEYVGDYPAVSTEHSQAIRLSRYYGYLAEAYADAALGIRNGAKRVEQWKKNIAKEFPNEQPPGPA